MCTKNLRVGITAGNLNLSFYYIMQMTALFASTAGELQLQLNVMNQWCYKDTSERSFSTQQYDFEQIRS